MKGYSQISCEINYTCVDSYKIPKYGKYGFSPLSNPNQIVHYLVWGTCPVRHLAIVELKCFKSILLVASHSIVYVILCFKYEMKMPKLNANDR